MTATIVDKPATRRAIPAGNWALGFVSMLMVISSEMIHALLPIYMVTVLGTSTLAVGVRRCDGSDSGFGSSETLRSSALEGGRSRNHQGHA